MGFKVNAKLPFFNGKPKEDIDLWFYSAEIFFKTNRVSEDYKVIVASNYLRNAALHSLRSLEMENQNLTWNEFKNELNLKSTNQKTFSKY